MNEASVCGQDPTYLVRLGFAMEEDGEGNLPHTRIPTELKHITKWRKRN